MNGYNFTERVRRVLALAREEAAALHSEYVGTEHMLLGIVCEGGGTASAVISNFGVGGKQLRARVMELVTPGQRGGYSGPDLPYTSRAKKALELSMSEARKFNHSYVGTEHLLLGLLSEAKGVAAQALNDVGVTLEEAREETLRVLVGAGGHLARRKSRATPEVMLSYPQRLREVMSDAYDTAGERGALDVTPAHAMIALLEHRDGMANTALDRLRFDRATALFALNDLAPRNGAVPPDSVLTPSAELSAALSATDQSQRDLHAPVPGTQHLLLGLLSASPDVAAVFAAQGIGYDVVVEEIRRGTG